MARHTHTWVDIVPKVDLVPDEHKADYWIDAFLLKRMRGLVYCSGCGKSGHKIKSHRGGIRTHTGTYFVDTANEIRKKYNFPLLNNNLHPLNH